MNNQFNQSFGATTQVSAPQCPNCGAALNPGQAFCPFCGTPSPAQAPASAPRSAVCSNCGTEIQAGGTFCPACGNNVSVSTVPPAIEAFNANVTKKKGNKKAPNQQVRHFYKI